MKRCPIKIDIQTFKAKKVNYRFLKLVNKNFGIDAIFVFKCRFQLN